MSERLSTPWDPEEAQEQEVVVNAGAGRAPDGLSMTDSGNAERLLDLRGDSLRYVHSWSRWIVYVDGRWVVDPRDALTIEAAKIVARKLREQLPGVRGDKKLQAMARFVSKSENVNGLKAMVTAARGLPGFVVHHEDLDADPWLLNVTNGTIDLRSGELLQHDPDDLLTMMTATRYEPDATSDLWASCLERWFPEAELRSYIQRLAGSFLSGGNLDEILPIGIGPGANGKSKFTAAIAGAMGDYAVIVDRDLLLWKKQGSHPTNIVDLFRRRLAYTGETSSGAKLDENRMKILTGGDRLKGRRMNEDFWEFTPTHTTFLHTNHPPEIRGTGEDVWRRIRSVPFTVTIPKEERDSALSAKLAAESVAVLAWAVKGCLHWQEEGLNEPESVAKATAAYRQQENVLEAFADEMLTFDPRGRTRAMEIRELLAQWAEGGGRREPSKEELADFLRDHRCVSRQTTFTVDGEKKRLMGWHGVRIVEDEE